MIRATVEDMHGRCGPNPPYGTSSGHELSGGIQAQDMTRWPMQAWVWCSVRRRTACDPHALGGDQCGEQRAPCTTSMVRSRSPRIFSIYPEPLWPYCRSTTVADSSPNPAKHHASLRTYLSIAAKGLVAREYGTHKRRQATYFSMVNCEDP